MTSSVIFDEEISKHITIVRTHFPHLTDETNEAKQARMVEKNTICDKLKKREKKPVKPKSNTKKYHSV